MTARVSFVDGSAVTSFTNAGESIMIHAASEVRGPADVPVVAAWRSSGRGVFGDLLAGLACAPDPTDALRISRIDT